MIIANWKVFTKAGEAGWKSIIPFLNTFVVFKISWNTMMFWAMLAASVLGSVLTGFAGEDGGILTILALICYIAAAAIAIIDVHKLSKSFGHGIGFTLGLLFFSPIFTLICHDGSLGIKGITGLWLLEIDHSQI